MSVNKAILVGRLGKDPELRSTESGKAVCTFSLATTDRWTGDDGLKKEATTWHNIVAWGRQAEVIKEYLAKGKEVYIEGRIVNRSYDDKEGNKRYVSEVVVQNFQFIGGKSSPETQTGQTNSGSGAEGPQGAENDDDLPF